MQQFRKFIDVYVWLNMFWVSLGLTTALAASGFTVGAWW